jgi:predicted XRE-type DNA-binding protein
MGKKKEIKINMSSGNIYADFGYPNPEEAKAKAALAIQIINVIKKKKLTQKEAAALMGIDQPKVSAIKRGQLASFTIDRLLRFMLALGLDILIDSKLHEEDSTRKSEPHIYVGQQRAWKDNRLTI